MYDTVNRDPKLFVPEFRMNPNSKYLVCTENNQKNLMRIFFENPTFQSTIS
jgi:hypothetical protein